MEENPGKPKKNWPLIAAIGIPVGMILLIFLSVYIPRFLTKPKHNFLFTFNNTTYRYTSPSPGLDMFPYNETIYEVKDGRLVANTQTYYYYKNEKPKTSSKLYLYDVKKNKSQEVSYKEVAKYKLDVNSIAPDGFEISLGNRGGGGFFPIFYDSGGYDYNSRFLRKRFASIKLNLPSQQTDYYYGYNNFQFLGWVIESDSVSGDSQNAVGAKIEEPVNNFTVTENENINYLFNLPAFPDANFFVNKLVKIEGLTPGGCNDSQPEKVKELVRLSSGCFDESAFDPNQTYDLFGLEIKVTNNSNSLIQGDLVKLVTSIDNQAASQFRIAERDIGFESYSVAPYEERFLRMSYWVPKGKSKLYIAYGPKLSASTPNLYGVILLQDFEGYLEIDQETLSIN